MQIEIRITTNLFEYFSSKYERFVLNFLYVSTFLMLPILYIRKKIHTVYQ